MLRRVAVACVLVLAMASRRERPERIFRDIHGAESAWHPNLVLGRTRRRPDRRRRPSSATLDCGLFRPPRCSATVSGRSAATGAARTTSRASPTSAISPARSPSASGTAPRSSGRSSSIPASTAICGRSSSTIREVGGIVDRYPRVHQRLDRRQRRRLLPRREDQPVVGVPPAARRRWPFRGDGEGADRRRGRGRLDREGRLPRSTSSPARNSGSGSSCRGSRAMSSAASRTASTFRAGRSGGAPGRASRRGARCAARSN